MIDPANNANETLKEFIDKKLKFLADNELYSLLGIPNNSSSAEIRDAYFRLAKQLHPDSIIKAGLGDIQPQALEVFKGIANAYRILGDPRKKGEYDAVWARAAGINSTPIEVKTRKDAVAEGRIHFHKASLLMKRYVWDEASVCIKKAIDLDPKNVEYLYSLGWCVMQNEKLPRARRYDEAKGWFDRAIQAEAPTADAYYYLSLYYKAVNDLPKQRLALQDALTFDPKHMPSLRERRLMNIRQKNKNQHTDLFASIKKFIEKLSGNKGNKDRK